MGVEIFLGNSLQSLDPQEDFYMVNLSSTFLSNRFELAMGQQSRVKNILKCFFFFCYITTANELVTHFCYMFSLYRNQSIDLHCKPMDWFLFDENIGPKWVHEMK